MQSDDEAQGPAGLVATSGRAKSVSRVETRPPPCEAVQHHPGGFISAAKRHGDWAGGRGVRGGWDCEVNCDCSFLSGGEERGWRFSGDESFHDPSQQHAPQLDAGQSLGVVVQGRRPSGGRRSPRL